MIGRNAHLKLPLPLPVMIPMVKLNYNFAMQQIIPGVFMHSSASIYQYLIVEKNQITLIDAGLPIFSRSLIRAITDIDHRAVLSQILITHADGDHYGAAKQLSETYHCPITASALEAAAISSGGMSRKLKPRNAFDRLLFSAALPLFTAAAVPVTQIIEPEQILPVLGGLQVLDSAGHTPGHLSFYQPERAILFVGDSIIKRHNVPSPAFGPNCWDELRAREAFERQMALKPRHICGGHSYFQM